MLATTAAPLDAAAPPGALPATAPVPAPASAPAATPPALPELLPTASTLAPLSASVLAAAAPAPAGPPRAPSGPQPGFKAIAGLDATPRTALPAAAALAGGGAAASAASAPSVAAGSPPAAQSSATSAGSQPAPTLLAPGSAPAPLADPRAPAQASTGFASLLVQAQQAQPAPNAEAAAAARPAESAAMMLVQAPAAPISAGPPDVAAAVHQAALPSRPLDAPFGGDLAAEVRVMLNGGMQRAELSLNPPELGPVRIELTLTAQTADINLMAAHSMTREGLSLALPELRQMLAGQGLSLGHAGVSSGQQGQAFAEAQQQARAMPHGMRTPAGGPETGAGWASGSAVVRPSRGMLDLYA